MSIGSMTSTGNTGTHATLIRRRADGQVSREAMAILPILTTACGPKGRASVTLEPEAGRASVTPGSGEGLASTENGTLSTVRSSDEPNPGDLLRSFPGRADADVADLRVNKPENDDPSILEPIEESTAQLPLRRQLIGRECLTTRPPADIGLRHRSNGRW